MLSVLSSTAGGLLLGLSFLFPHLGVLAYFAFVPLFFLTRSTRVGPLYGHALWMGFVAFALANHWIYLFLLHLTGAPWLAAGVSGVYFFYCANAVALLFIGLQRLRRHTPLWSFFLLAPPLAAAFLHAFPLVFELNLAQTQVDFPQVTAPIRLTGTWSLSVFIVLINLLFAEWLLLASQTIANRQILAKTSLSANFAVFSLVLLLAPLLWLCAGWLSLSAAAPKKDAVLKLGIIQTDDAPGFAAPEAKAGYTLAYPPELAQAYRLAQQGAEVIVWPESRPKGILANDWVRESYGLHARQMQADLIVQDLARAESSAETYINASLLFGRDGTQAVYQKMKPIPFGESIPTIFRFEPVQSWLTRLFKNIYKPVHPGSQTELFPVGDHTLLPLICYEIFARRSIANTLKQHPQVDLIVLQSNDRWFHSRHQVIMHNAVAQLRAVETARPILHVVNGGPSFFIDAHGNVQAITDYRRAAAYLLEVALPQQSAP